jgi:peptidyl-prolyl cis-trans isomerase C
MASVNGLPLHPPGQVPDEAELRQRACSELLRQRAQALGLLGVDDQPAPDGAISQAASEAIEQLLALELQVPEPDEAACRRHHAANASRYVRDERVRLRHLLFAVTPGVDVVALRSRAEQVLLALRCADDPQAFAEQARTLSNCPSGAQGGELGWLAATDLAPELAREIFGRAEVGVLPRLLHSRFGLHVVQVLQRQGGEPLPYEQVAGAVRLALKQHSWANALRQYLQVLAGQAQLQGVALQASETPLVR